MKGKDPNMSSERSEVGPVLTEVQIVPVKPRDGLLAFASFVLNSAFYVGDVAIYSRLGQEGYRLVFPMKALANGAKVNIFHPIKKDVARSIEQQVTKAYEELLAKVHEERRGGEDDGQD
jgi:stage V sporulation protein G